MHEPRSAVTAVRVLPVRCQGLKLRSGRSEVNNRVSAHQVDIVGGVAVMSKPLEGVGAAAQQIGCSNRESSDQEPVCDWQAEQPTDGSPAGPSLQVMQVTLGRSDSSSGMKSR
jgi:hypothetical protein